MMLPRLLPPVGKSLAGLPDARAGPGRLIFAPVRGAVGAAQARSGRALAEGAVMARKSVCSSPRSSC